MNYIFELNKKKYNNHKDIFKFLTQHYLDAKIRNYKLLYVLEYIIVI